MEIKELVDKLIEKTSNDLYQWEKQKNNLYRLVLSNGSISLEGIFNYGQELYVISLYDKDSCFAKYSSLEEKEVAFKQLFISIEACMKRKIEKKIDDVFGDV